MAKIHCIIENENNCNVGVKDTLTLNDLLNIYSK